MKSHGENAPAIIKRKLDKIKAVTKKQWARLIN